MVVIGAGRLMVVVSDLFCITIEGTVVETSGRMHFDARLGSKVVND